MQHGTANTRDINQEAAMLIGQDIKARGLSNVKQQPQVQVQVQTLQAKNFSAVTTNQLHR